MSASLEGWAICEGCVVLEELRLSRFRTVCHAGSDQAEGGAEICQLTAVWPVAPKKTAVITEGFPQHGKTVVVERHVTDQIQRLRFPTKPNIRGSPRRVYSSYALTPRQGQASAVMASIT